MPFDGSGNYTPSPAPNFPAVGGATISSTYYNNVINDIATALNNVLTRDGQGKPSGPINWNGQNLTAVGALSAISATFGTPLPANSGGVGLDGSAAGNGKLLIGNGAGYTLANLTAGAGINITNSAGGITIAATVSMVYPGAGIAVSTGAAWGTSKAAPTGALVGDTDAQTLTNKTVNLANNTVAGTLAQFNTACSDADFAAAGWTQIAQVNTTSGSVVKFTNIPQTYADLMAVFDGVSLDNTTGNCSYALSTDDVTYTANGTAFGALSVATDTAYGALICHGYSQGRGVVFGGVGVVNTNPNIAGNIGGFGFRVNSGVKYWKFQTGSGSFDAGVITLYGR